MESPKILTKRQYLLYRLWPVIWFILFIFGCVLYYWYWNKINLYFKILIVAIIGITAPDDYGNLFKSYDTYKKEVEERNLEKYVTEKSEDIHKLLKRIRVILLVGLTVIIIMIVAIKLYF